MPTGNTSTAVDAYILAQPPAIQAALKKMRAIIKKAAPEAEEVISYAMPAYKYHGMLVYFGGAKSHVGFYPTPSAIMAFEAELSGYTYAKGSIQFPLDKPLPAALITKMVKFRLQENEEKAAMKGKK